MPVELFVYTTVRNSLHKFNGLCGRYSDLRIFLLGWTRSVGFASVCVFWVRGCFGPAECLGSGTPIAGLTTPTTYHVLECRNHLVMEEV